MTLEEEHMLALQFQPENQGFLQGDLILWVPDEQTARVVISITKRNDEPSLCANFSNGDYAALYGCEPGDFVIGYRFW